MTLPLQMDSDHGIDQADTRAALRVGETAERLDAALGYLRFVHTYCYYCGVQYETDAAMVKECGLSHTRPSVGPDDGSGVDVGLEWAAGVDKRIASAMEERERDGEGGREDMERRFMLRCVAYEGDGKCRCKATDDCKKLFKSEEFLQKHLRLKHEDLLTDFVADHKRALAFDAFRSDPHRLSLSDNIPSNRSDSSNVISPRLLPPYPQPFHPLPFLPLPLQGGRGHIPFYPPNAQAFPLYHPPQVRA